ncbi:uncharacterized protein LOC142984355 [Anticarsia gemmatalis]|uniref:uncharacterized protein LOC142984355 n=1 Tax=Anticarsia gemmatalis TaxID=129554 RepID=UPI003F7667DA
MSTLPEYITKPTTKLTTKFPSTPEFLGTAEIEELLNDIKAKALQSVVENTPTLADMITNTATEVIFREESTSALRSEVYDEQQSFTEKEIFSHRTLGRENPDSLHKPVLVIDPEPHYLVTRSLKDDTMTIAHNNLTKPDKLTVKHSTSKATKMKTTSHIATTTSPKRMRGEKKSVKAKNTVKPSQPTPRTMDDYMMLTLYEQMLEKTHEDNIMKMLATAKLPLKKRMQQHCGLSKRNSETLTDLKLKEDVEKNDDDILIPDYDYAGSTSPYFDTEYTPTERSESDYATTDGTSYQELCDKISYKDFVNGYKYYLKFQKDQAKQNFSALVRYQAHKHHSVDDIGKYILEKIPQLPSEVNASIPNSRIRRFFEDMYIDDQEMSTKSDESWFKKYFYIFIDNDPTKKFHQSQTVPLKTPVNEVETTFLYPASSTAFDTPTSVFEASSTEPYSSMMMQFDDDVVETSPEPEQTPKISLAELSKSLDEIRKTNLNSIEDTTQTTSPTKGISDIMGFNTIPLNFVHKIFRHKRKRLSTEISTQFDSERIKRASDNATSIEDIESSTTPKMTETTKKYGYLDIDVVPVAEKAKTTTTKKSRIKEFFKKLVPHHKVKPKRDARIPRFNPLKRIKEIFKPKSAKANASSFTLDYDLLTSHADNLKPLKYKINIEQMKQQVPNISDINNIDSFGMPITTTPKADFLPVPKQKEKYLLKVNENKNFLHLHPDRSLIPVGSTYIKTAAPVTTAAERVCIKEGDRKILSVYVKPGKPDFVRTVSMTESPRLMTLADLRLELDKIRYKLSRRRDKPERRMFRINALTLNPMTYHRRMKYKKKKMENLERLSDDYISVSDDRLISDYLQEDNLPSPKLKTTKPDSTTTTPTTPPLDQTEENTTKLKYYDYFNDLLMWHNDILHLDKVPKPLFKEFKSDSDFLHFTPTK